MTREELLAVARRAYELHPDVGSAGAADPLLTLLLGQIDNAYDPSRPVESAKEALQHVALAVFVVLSALYALYPAPQHPECGGTVTLQKMQAGFHFAHTYAPTVITVPACDSCSYFDTHSTEFREALRQAEMRFEEKHPGLIEKMRDRDRSEREEILHCSAEDMIDAKDARVCGRCGTAARRRHARFCWNCGSPLPNG